MSSSLGSNRYTLRKISNRRESIAILSVYNKTGLLDLAKGLTRNHVRLLGSGGTAKMIRDAGFEIELVSTYFFISIGVMGADPESN